MKALYIDIRNRLKDAIPQLAWIDLFAGQFDRPQEHYPSLLPCVFVEIGTIEYEPKRTGTHRIGRAEITLHIGQDFYTDTYAERLQGNLGGEEDFFDLLEEVKNAIEAYESETFSPMVLARAEYTENISNVLVHRLVFRCTVTEDLAKKYTISKPTLNILR